MKIAFSSSIGNIAWGGSEALWSQVAIRLAQAGTKVGVSVALNPGSLPNLQRLSSAGCILRWQTERLTLVRRVLRRLTRTNRSDTQWLRWFAPDLVVISLSEHTYGTSIAKTCRHLGLRYALIVQSAREAVWIDDAMIDELRDCYEQAAHCYFVSLNTQKMVESHLATRLTEATVVRNPFNVRYDASPSWPPDDGLTRLACVGYLAPVAKGQDLIIDVLSKERWRQRPLLVSLIGSESMQGRRLKRLAALHGLNQVSFCGFQMDIEQIWAGHHALLLPSRYEGLPLVLVEAMLCNRLGIVTDVGGNREYVEDGVNGFVAAAATSDLLDDAMERAWKRRAEWRDMGHLAGQAARRLTPTDPVACFVEQLQELV